MQRKPLFLGLVAISLALTFGSYVMAQATPEQAAAVAQNAAHAAEQSAQAAHTSANAAGWMTFGYGLLLFLPGVIWWVLVLAFFLWDGIYLCYSAFRIVSPDRGSIPGTIWLFALFFVGLHLFGVVNVPVFVVNNAPRVISIYLGYVFLGVVAMTLIGIYDIKHYWANWRLEQLNERKEDVKREVTAKLQSDRERAAGSKSRAKSAKASQPFSVLEEPLLAGDLSEDPELRTALAEAWENDYERKRLLQPLKVKNHVPRYIAMAGSFWALYLLWRVIGDTITNLGKAIGKWLQKLADDQLPHLYSVDINT